MPGAVARQGDIAGGTITSTLPTVTVGGLPIARVGDVIAPHGEGVHSASVIAAGSGTVLAGGIPVARLGDLASCGHPIASGDVTVIAGP